MSTQELRSIRRCHKLRELPLVVNDWQQKAWCPDCEYYDCGRCCNPRRWDSEAACPFEGGVIALRELPMEKPDNSPGNSFDPGPCDNPETPPRTEALEQAVKLRIRHRTGGRIRALSIDLTDRELVVRGIAPSYYIKQLALQGVLDVLQARQETRIEFNFQVVVCPSDPNIDILTK